MPPKGKCKKSEPARKSQAASQYATRSSFRKSATVMSYPLVYDSDDDEDTPPLPCATETREERTTSESNDSEAQIGKSQAVLAAQSQDKNFAESQFVNIAESQFVNFAESQFVNSEESQPVGSEESQPVGSGVSQTLSSGVSQTTQSESQLTQSNSSLWSTRTVERNKRKAVTSQDTNTKKRSRAFKSEDFGESAKLMEMARHDVRKLHLTVSPRTSSTMLSQKW